MPNDEMPKEVVGIEVAQVDFERLCKGRRLKTKDDTWTDDEQKAFAYIRETICGAICEGRLSVNDSDDPVFMPIGAPENVPTKITFKKAGGSTLLAMDGKAGAARQFAAYADMAGISASHFGKLMYWDLDLLAKLFALFFAPR
jgi:hypothetical protein